MKRMIKEKKRKLKPLFSKKEILNFPNGITVFRLLLLPFFIYYLKNDAMISAVIFTAITLLDKVDGVVARFFKKETRFGRFFDGFVDSIIIFFALIYLWIYSYLNAFYVWSIIFLGFIGAVIIYVRIKKDRGFFVESRMYHKIAAGSIYLLIFVSIFRIDALVLGLIFYLTLALNIYRIFLDLREAFNE